MLTISELLSTYQKKKIIFPDDIQNVKTRKVKNKKPKFWHSINEKECRLELVSGIQLIQECEVSFDFPAKIAQRVSFVLHVMSARHTRVFW